VKYPLERSGISGNLSVRWLGNYGSGIQYGFSPLSLYQVDVVGKQ